MAQSLAERFAEQNNSMKRSRTCFTVSRNASQSLSVIAHSIRYNFGLLRICCGQIPAAIAADAIIAIFVYVFTFR